MMIPILLSMLALSPQATRPDFSPWTAEHTTREFARRESLFFEAWDHAPGPRWQEFALTELERSRRSGEPRSLNPSSAAISDSLHFLLREEDPAGELSRGQRFMDSLGVALVPGIVAGSPTGGTQPVTVHFHPLYDAGRSVPREVFELVVTWNGPGGESEEARRELVDPRAVATGFELFIQSPKGGPGTWWLQASLMSAEGTAVTGLHPVRFEVVPELDELESVLQDEIARGTLQGLERERAQRSLNELKALRELGLQPPSMETLLVGLGLVPKRLERTTAERVRVERSGTRRMDPSDFGAKESRGEVLLLLSSEERAGSVLAGPEAEAWAGLARAGWHVVEIKAPLMVVEGSESRSFQQLLEERDEKASRALWVVARGDATSRLMLGIHGETDLGRAFRAHVDGLVLETAAPPTRPGGGPRRALLPPRWPEGPRVGFVLTAGAGGDAIERMAPGGDLRWSWIRRQDPLFLARRELPSRLVQELQE